MPIVQTSRNFNSSFLKIKTLNFRIRSWSDAFIQLLESYTEESAILRFISVGFFPRRSPRTTSVSENGFISQSFVVFWIYYSLPTLTEKIVVRFRLLFFSRWKFNWFCPFHADFLCCTAETLVSGIIHKCGYQPLLENLKRRDWKSLSLCPSLTCVQTFVSTLLNVKCQKQGLIGEVDFFLDKFFS